MAVNHYENMDKEMTSRVSKNEWTSTSQAYAIKNFPKKKIKCVDA